MLAMASTPVRQPASALRHSREAVRGCHVAMSLGCSTRAPAVSRRLVRQKVTSRTDESPVRA